MSNRPLFSIGITMPRDFPSVPYDEIKTRVRSFSTSTPDTWSQFAGGWNAVAYRYSACTDYDVAFTESIQRYGDAPPPQERCLQEKYLFGFFVSGLATLESVCYGLFAMASLLDPTHFPLSADDEMRAVTPRYTTDHYSRVFSGEGITNTLLQLVNSHEFSDWREIRNILAHRTAPGRIIHASTSGTAPPALWKTGIPLDANTTVSRRTWLSTQLQRLITEANAFARIHFP